MPGCCSRCGRRVFAAEEKLALGRSWHVECYTCAICNRTLDSSNLSECKIRDEIYCNSCYRKYLGLQGYGFGVTNPTLVNHNPLIMDKLPNDCGEGEKFVENGVQDPRLIPPPPSRLGQSFMARVRMPFYYQNHPSLKPGDPCASPPRSITTNDCEDYDRKSETISSNIYDDSYKSDPNYTDPNYDQTESEDWRPISPQRQTQRSPIRNNKHRNFELSSDEYQASRKYCISSPPPRRLQRKLNYDDVDIAPNPPCPPARTIPYRTNNYPTQSPFQRKANVEKSNHRKYC